LKYLLFAHAFDMHSWRFNVGLFFLLSFNRSVLQAPQGNDATSSAASMNSATGVAHPYRLQPMMPKFDDDFPLRKTGM